MLPEGYRSVGGTSFAEFLAQQAPEMLPGARMQGPADHTSLDITHGTTIVAATFADGVVMAGDRRATMGNVIAQRDIQKVFATDEYSCVGIAGTAGIAVEMTRLFRVELEHYEKIEGAVLSTDGKANRLATLIRNNLSLAMQGLAVVPLFAAYDLHLGAGRIFAFDVTGNKNEERTFHSVGSGSMFARGSLKKLYRENMARDEITTVVIQALYDAADDDSATGGPDMARRIFPMVSVITADGYTALPESETSAIADRVISARMSEPDGPNAPLI